MSFQFCGDARSWDSISRATSFAKSYGGPCPPPGKPHRYFFRLYALNARLELKPGASKADLEAAIHSHALAEAQYMGTYGR